MLAEGLRGRRILHPGGQLLREHPCLEVLGALGLLVPLVPDVVEALFLRRQAEAGEGDAEDRGSEVAVSLLPEPLLPLVLREFDLRRLLVLGRRLLRLLLLLLRSVVLRLFRLVGALVRPLLSVRLPRRLLMLPPLPLRRALHPPLLALELALPLGEDPPLRLLELLPLELGVRGRLLLLQQLRVGPVLERPVGLAHDDARDAPEVRQVERRQGGLALLLEEVAADLHNHQGPRSRGGDGLQQRAGRQVVDGRDAEAHLRPVIGEAGGDGVVRPRPPDRARLGPLEDLAVAQLRELRVLIEELVQPIEGPLVRDADREAHLALAVLWLRSRCNLNVIEARVLDQPASEGHLRHRRGPEVHVQGQVPPSDRREERLALQRIGQFLRLADALAVTEQAHGVGVGAGGVQVDEHGQHLLSGELVRDHR
mmetsp:Transcript_122387/g.351667  ORF Transcript_122387/g.351667 Transcript_122387/m.351667 type:complete len:425 (+) Transcript_122387:712-1986(+)